MDYVLFPKVTKSGFANTGLTAVINDRDTSVTVPWEVAQTGDKDIEWYIENEEGNTYKVTIPIKVSYDSSTQKSTATYAKGTYTITAQQNGGV